MSPPASASAPFTGRFSDARSPASIDVRVAIAGRELVIERADGLGDSLERGAGDGLRPVHWPLAKVTTAEPLAARACDVLVYEPDGGGSTLFVADPDFVARLAASAPHLTARARRWHGLAPFAAVAAIIAIVGGAMYVTDASPARGIARLLPHGTRAVLGREVIRQSTGGHEMCTRPAGRAALDVLARRLSEAAGGKTAFKVSVADVDVVNAFAAPGEQIVILRKLLVSAGSADEVAGILAHEMGHGLELHPETSIVRAVGLITITEFVLGGNGGTLANIGLYLTQLGYSRQAEREADAHAARILKAAGIANRGIVDFFKRLSKGDPTDSDPAAKSTGRALDVLRTHPSTAERMQTFEQLPAYPATPALTDEQWRDLKAICGDAKASGQVERPRPAPQQLPRDI